MVNDWDFRKPQRFQLLLLTITHEIANANFSHSIIQSFNYSFFG